MSLGYKTYLLRGVFYLKKVIHSACDSNLK